MLAEHFQNAMYNAEIVHNKVLLHLTNILI